MKEAVGSTEYVSNKNVELELKILLVGAPKSVGITFLLVPMCSYAVSLNLYAEHVPFKMELLCFVAVCFCTVHATVS